MNSYRGITAVALLSLVGSCISLSAQAQAKLAGSSLLTASDQVQLGAWLGEGQIVLNNVYAKAQGDTSVNFHRAADGRGRTFSVMQASNASGQTWLIGGYNPQSWSSAGGYNMTVENNLRTGFLFNLTMGALHRQTPRSYALDSVGSFQTYNDAGYGPTFGVGHDLYVPTNLSSGGHSSLYSYIDPITGNFGVSILDGTTGGGSHVSFGAIEVFTINVVPEPATYGMMFAGLAVMGAVARRQKKVAA